jgi:DNA repair/transcription protein MET18/MMS19
MQDLALATFRSLFSTLYPDHVPSPVSETTIGGEDAEMQTGEAAGAKVEEKIAGVAVQVVDNSLDEFKEPEKNNAKPAVRILTALIASSGTSRFLFFL